MRNPELVLYPLKIHSASHMLEMLKYFTLCDPARQELTGHLRLLVWGVRIIEVQSCVVFVSIIVLFSPFFILQKEARTLGTLVFWIAPFIRGNEDLPQVYKVLKMRRNALPPFPTSLSSMPRSSFVLLLCCFFLLIIFSF